MQNYILKQASTQDLVTAWELNTYKLVTLLEQTLFLRVHMQEMVSADEFSDVIFIDSLETLLEQFRLLANKE